MEEVSSTDILHKLSKSLLSWYVLVSAVSVLLMSLFARVVELLGKKEF